MAERVSFAPPERYIKALPGGRGPLRLDPADMSDELETRRKRLLFRSWHRGTKETDLLLGSFAERHLADFTPEQLDRYEALLEHDDADLYDWLVGRLPPPEGLDTDVFRLLLAFRYTPRSA